jgi:hypothetical protein
MLEPVHPQDVKNELELMKHVQKIMQEQKDTLCDLS